MTKTTNASQAAAAGTSTSHKTVRFAVDTDSLRNGNEKRRDKDDRDGNRRQEKDALPLEDVASPRRKKRPRMDRPNEDEMDDVDDWTPEDDVDIMDKTQNESNTNNPTVVVPNERTLLEAKRKRRLQRQMKQTKEIKDNELDDDYDDDEDCLVDRDATTASSSLTYDDRERSLAAEGIPVEPFNMEQEKTDGTGYFDGDTYVFRKRRTDEDEEPDAWVETLLQNNGSSNNSSNKNDDDDDEQQNYNPLRNQHQRKTDQDNEEEEEEEDLDNWTEQELYAKILPLVSDSETVMQAIVRYGNLIKRKTPPTNRKPHPNNAKKRKEEMKINDDTNDVNSNNNDSAEQAARLALNDLTRTANALLLQGKLDIYQKKRSDLLLLLPTTDTSQHVLVTAPEQSTVQASDRNNCTDAVDQSQTLAAASATMATTATATTTQWEYQGSQDGQIHGPFTTEQMKAWVQAGYFVGASAVLIRPVTQQLQQQPQQTTTTTHSKSIQDDLLSDLMDDDDKEEEEDPKDEKSSTNPVVPVTSVVRGDWIRSDQVDFGRY